MGDLRRLDTAISQLSEQLRERGVAGAAWEGHLASSALSTGTAILALHLAATANSRPTLLESASADGDPLADAVEAGRRWLVDHQNADGGWGDTVRSRSNISTTALVWAALSMATERKGTAISQAETWLRAKAGSLEPDVLAEAIKRRYGKDRTFSVPILTVLAIAGKLGEGRAAWRRVPQFPFELAACPHEWFQWLQLPVVSYALPALIAIGQARHRKLEATLASLSGQTIDHRSAGVSQAEQLRHLVVRLARRIVAGSADQAIHTWFGHEVEARVAA